MIQQADSLLEMTADGAGEEVKTVRHGPPTPYEVSRWMPDDCTPEQLDSAIQANCPVAPVTNWSHRPDTLHLPGQLKPVDPLKAPLPSFMEHSFFADDSLYHPELKAPQNGIAGTPVPYVITGDNVITGVLLACFMLASVALAHSHSFLARQAKNFFREPHHGTTEITETSSELRYQLFFVLQSCLLYALVFFFWGRSDSDAFVIEQYQVIGLYTAVIAVYYGVKAGLYTLVDSVFFDMKRNEQWLKAALFLTSMQGVVLYPAVLIMAFFGLADNTVALIAVIVVVLVKILSFLKCYIVFFKRKGGFVQNILYFCALEMMPLALLWGSLLRIGSYLKINF